jgi:hypothetical protein
MTGGMLAFPAGVETEAEAHTPGSRRAETLPPRCWPSSAGHHLAQVIRASLPG